MRPSTSRDRNRLERAGVLILVATVALASPVLGDGPAKDEPKDRPDLESRVMDGAERFFNVIDRVLNAPKNPWLNKVVVLKSLETDLRVDGKPVPVPGGRVFREFLVEKIGKGKSGERLWLEDGQFKGWVDADKVVLKTKAHDYFSDLIRRGPASAEAHYLRASLKQADALADLAEAIRLDPKFAPAHVALASIHSSKKDASKEDKARALADLAEAIRLDANLASAYVDRSSIYIDQKDYDRAIADLNEAIRLNPADSASFFARGGSFSEKEEWDRAIADLSEAIRLDPWDGKTEFTMIDMILYMRGSAYKHSDQYDLAIADFTEALRIARLWSLIPKDDIICVCLYSRAEAWDSKKDFDRALAGFSEAIEKAPKPWYKSLGYSGRARVRRHSKDFNGALADYAEALRFDPPPVVAAVCFSNRGRIESDRDDPEAAIADCSKAVQVMPDSPMILAGRAQVLTSHGRHAPALADCDRAVELAPRNAWGHDIRAWIRATCPDPKFRDGKKAVEGATLACDLTSWKNSSCLETLAAAQAESGDFDSAVKWQARALELAKDDEAKVQARDRLELFRKKQPFRDVRPANVDRRASHPIPEIPLTAR